MNNTAVAVEREQTRDLLVVIHTGGVGVSGTYLVFARAVWVLTVYRIDIPMIYHTCESESRKISRKT